MMCLNYRTGTSEKYRTGILAAEIAFSIHKFFNGRFLKSSAVDSVVRYADGWLVTTQNSLYALLDKAEICEYPESEAEKIMRSDSNRFLKLLKKEETDERLYDILKKKWDSWTNEIREMKGKTAILTFSADADYYLTTGTVKDGDTMITVYPDVHVGMFQDSVLLINRYDDPVSYDFRFFPYGDNRLKFYSWDHEYSVILRNEGNESMEIDTPFGDFLIPPGESIIPVQDKEHRITDHIAPNIDKHTIWETRVLDTGMIAYGGPQIGGKEENDADSNSKREESDEEERRFT